MQYRKRTYTSSNDEGIWRGIKKETMERTFVEPKFILPRQYLKIQKNKSGNTYKIKNESEVIQWKRLINIVFIQIRNKKNKLRKRLVIVDLYITDILQNKLNYTKKRIPDLPIFNARMI